LSSRLASEAAAAVLRAGGNAADAAVALSSQHDFDQVQVRAALRLRSTWFTLRFSVG